MKNIYKLDDEIYITSDEKIKEGDWVIANNGLLAKVINEFTWHFINSKKVILTTDIKLIDDGVQAIDDEFLEWFVKNPSCEEVEVEFNNRGVTVIEKILKTFGEYKIIIPQEEPKQLTVEEALLLMKKAPITFVPNKRMYSEEIEILWLKYRAYTNNEDAWSFKEWLVEQFKNK